jgi:hypothetical protein
MVSFIFPWDGDQPIPRPLPTPRTTQAQNQNADIHASSGIRTHDDPSMRAREHSSCLRPRATVIGKLCDQLLTFFKFSPPLLTNQSECL